GVLFGAAAGWQPGESSIDEFQRSFGRVFHGDTTGKIDDAQRELMAGHALLHGVGLGDASDYLYWLDPYSAEGRLAGQKIRPVAHDLRIMAESALVNVERARSSGTREMDALDAL